VQQARSSCDRKESYLLNNKEEEEVVMQIERVETKKEFDGQGYVLTKINYSEEDSKDDVAWHKERGTEARIVQDGIFWLVYTKLGG